MQPVIGANGLWRPRNEERRLWWGRHSQPPGAFWRMWLMTVCLRNQYLHFMNTASTTDYMSSASQTCYYWRNQLDKTASTADYMSAASQTCYYWRNQLDKTASTAESIVTYTCLGKLGSATPYQLPVVISASHKDVCFCEKNYFGDILWLTDFFLCMSRLGLDPAEELSP